MGLDRSRPRTRRARRAGAYACAGLALALQLAAGASRAEPARSALAPGLIEHFSANGIDLTLQQGRDRWIAPLPDNDCYSVVTGFLNFGSRDALRKEMMRYSLASAMHPTLNLAMFDPGLIRDGAECDDATPPSLDPVRERYLRVFNSFRSNSAGPSGDTARRTADPLLDALVGEWTMKGKLAGEAVDYRMNASWVLGWSFLRLEIVERSDPPAYEALVFIGREQDGASYVAHWLDGFGGGTSRTLGSGSADDKTLTLNFEYPERPLRDTFTYHAGTNQWYVLIESRQGDGSWEVFAEYTLER